jgi:hypothetical protein
MPRYDRDRERSSEANCNFRVNKCLLQWRDGGSGLRKPAALGVLEHSIGHALACRMYPFVNQSQRRAEEVLNGPGDQEN